MSGKLPVDGPETVEQAIATAEAALCQLAKVMYADDVQAGIYTEAEGAAWAAGLARGKVERFMESVGLMKYLVKKREV
jgi:hypothetical protein